MCLLVFLDGISDLNKDSTRLSVVTYVCLIMFSLFCVITCNPCCHVCPVLSHMSRIVTYVSYCHVCPVLSRVSRIVTCVSCCHVCPILSRVSRIVTCVSCCPVCVLTCLVPTDPCCARVSFIGCRGCRSCGGGEAAAAGASCKEGSWRQGEWSLQRPLFLLLYSEKIWVRLTRFLRLWICPKINALLLVKLNDNLTLWAAHWPVMKHTSHWVNLSSAWLYRILKYVLVSVYISRWLLN